MQDDGWVHVRRPAEKDYWSPTSGDGEPSPSSSQPLKLIFTAPAKYWTDAIPIGNGRLGAMIWGNVAKDTLQLNEDTLWTGVPGNYTDPDDPAALSKVRKLVDDGQFTEATKEAVKLSDRPSEVYQLLGDMILEFDTLHLKYDERTYHRELDLDTATATVKYSNNLLFPTLPCLSLCRFSAAIAEMLVQSTVKDLYLLPALPRDKWANGCVKGLKARGGVTVNVCWKEGDLHEVGLWSTGRNSIQQRLHYRGRTVNASLSSGKAYTFNMELRCIRTYSLSLLASC